MGNSTASLGAPRAAARPVRQVKRIEPTTNASARTIVVPPKVVKKRVAAYARVSTDQESQEGSYTLQCQHYADYISEHENWTMVKVYADEGKTGTSTKGRTEFKQMIADAEAGKIDMIITKSISRFARNTVDCLETIRKLKNLPIPVSVYFEKENIDSLDGKSEFILTILSSLAQDESRSISENIKWSFQKLYEQGYVFCPTTRLLGYDTVIDRATGEKHIVIEPVGASVVKMIYDLFLEGYGYSEIAHRIEQMGAKTGASRTKWTEGGIRRILANEKYVGDVVTQKGYTRDFLTHERAKNEGQLPQYIAENHHEAIIDRPSWVAAQERMKAGLRKKPAGKGAKSNEVPPHYSNRTVFSTKLYCANCGAKLLRRSTSTSRVWKGETRYFIWRCRNAEGRGNCECTCSSIPELVLQQSFMAMLVVLAARPREELEEEFRLANGVEIREPENADELRLELEGIKRQLDTIKDDSELYTEMLEELRTRKSEIERELNITPDWSLLSPLKRANFDWLLEQLKTIRPFDANTTTIPFSADIYSSCIERGEVREVMENKRLIDIVIRYSFVCGLEVVAYGNRCSIAIARARIDAMEAEEAKTAARETVETVAAEIE